MRFIVDGMLGKLVRWLRLSGHDALYVDDPQVNGEDEDHSLVRIASAQNRTLLTSDVELYRQAKKRNVKSVLLKKEEVVDQLLELSRFLGKKIEVDFENSRCPICNGELKETAWPNVEKIVPEKIAKTHQRFWICKGCGKVYWEGSHWENIRKTAEEYERKVKDVIS